MLGVWGKRGGGNYSGGLQLSVSADIPHFKKPIHGEISEGRDRIISKASQGNYTTYPLHYKVQHYTAEERA